MSKLKKLLAEKKIIICAGTGGVGKTTISSSIAFNFANNGYKTLVMTIDPAKRLADSLGISDLGNTITKVPYNFEGSGSLYAMMLDKKKTFDDLVKKYTGNSEKEALIKQNFLYQKISSALAGAQEYMAIEKLFEIKDSGEFDKIILDTPPSSNALDFINAPQKMIDFCNENILKWFLLDDNKSMLSFLNFGKTKILWLLEKITDSASIRNLTEFFSNFSGLYSGFRERAEHVRSIFVDDSTCFLIILTPEERAVKESLNFYKKLQERNIKTRGFILNQVLVPSNKSLDAKNYLKNIKDEIQFKEIAGKHSIKEIKEFLEESEKLFHAYNLMSEYDNKNKNLIKNEAEKNVLYFEVPFFKEDVYSLVEIKKFSNFLFSAE